MPPAAPCSDSPALLTPHAALATRIVRSGLVPPTYAVWLAAPHRAQQPPQELSHDAVAESMAKLLRPVGSDTAPHLPHDMLLTARWCAAIVSHVAQSFTRTSVGLGPQLIAACLLPLYRCLATGNLGEGIQFTRLRLAEALALAAVCELLGEDLSKELEAAGREGSDPGETLKLFCDLELSLLRQSIAVAARDVDEQRGDVPQRGIEELCQLDAAEAPVTPDWACNSLLWNLAGELTSCRAELVLPRAWIDTPVPWRSISEHWQQLDKLLFGLQADRGSTGITASDHQAPVCDSAWQSGHGYDDRGSPVFADSTGVTNEKNTLPTSIEAVNPNSSSLQRAGHCNPVCGTETADGRQTSKVMIAHIHSHSDPVFVSAIGRQLASCRSDNRVFSLVTLVVQGGVPQRPVSSSSLAALPSWAPRLLNRLAEHPHAIAPSAFVTTAGELILSLVDLERHEATRLVRDGLAATLHGRREEADGMPHNPPPLWYHVGIASIDSPRPGLAPEQVVESMLRCLSAASCNGRDTIKSIEVF